MVTETPKPRLRPVKRAFTFSPTFAYAASHIRGATQQLKPNDLTDPKSATPAVSRGTLDIDPIESRSQNSERTKDSDPVILEGFHFVIRSRSSTSENDANENRFELLRREFTNAILLSLQREPVEAGQVGEADRIVEGAIKVNRLATLAWLNSLFIEKFDSPSLAADILLLVGRLPYATSMPTGVTMAVGALSHREAIVKEAAIRAFERWANAESLRVLENVSLEIKWLSDYLECVKSDIREQLCLS